MKTCSKCGSSDNEFPERGLRCKPCIRTDQNKKAKDARDVKKALISFKVSRTCSKCDIVKLKCDFPPQRTSCKPCISLEAKAWRAKNKEWVIERRRKHYVENKQSLQKIALDNYYNNQDHNITRNKQWKADNPDKVKKNWQDWSSNNKDRIRDKGVKYRKDNPDKIKEKKKRESKRISDRKKYDIVFKMKLNIRSLISSKFSQRGFVKKSKSIEILGCDFEELHIHLLKTFHNNYGRPPTTEDSLHIDHLIPISLADTEEQVIELNHFSNLQWLLKKDNLRKGNKIGYQTEKGIYI